MDTETSNAWKIVHSYTIPECVYTFDKLETYALSDPYTLPQFASATLNAARAGSNWVNGYGLGAYLTMDLPPDGNRKYMYAELLRYRIRFKSKLGVKYTVKWDLKIDQLYPDQQSWLIKDLVQGGIIGNGKTNYTRWLETPEPVVDQHYTAEIVNIRIESDGGGCGSGICGDDGSDSPGDGEDFLSSAGFYISLGAGTVEESAGVIKMDEEIPSANLATPSALQFDINTSAVTVVTNGDGSIHLAAPTVLARIVVTNSYAYWIHCSTTNGGAYLTNSPFISHLIINPNGSTNTNTLRHVRFRSGSAITNEFTCEAATSVTNTWSLVSGNGLRGERLSKIIDTNTQTRLESYSISTPATSAQLYRRDRLYWQQVHNDFLLSETVDPGGLNLLTTNSYDSLGRLQLSLKPDGSWERREYDADGWLIRIVRPLTNQPPTASTNDCRVTEYSYSVLAGSPDNQPDSAASKPRTVWEIIAGQIVAKTMYAYLFDFETFVQIAAQPSDGWDANGNEKTHAAEDIDHRPTRIDNSDGTYTKYTYTDDASGRLTTTKSYDSSSTEFRRVEEQVNTMGRLVSRKTYDSASSILIDQQLYSDPDEFWRPTKTTYLDDTTSVTVKQDCCNAAYTIDRDGIASTNSYDNLKRLVSTIRLGITTSNLQDTAGRTLAQFRKGTDGSLITLRSMGYDAANRVIRETNALGFVTCYSYVVDGNNQSVLTTTNADGGTRIETRFRDGEIASITGTAAFPVRYGYGVESESSVQRAYTKEIKLDSGGGDTAEVLTNFVDAAGRAYKTGFPGSTGPYQQSFYNNLGQFWKQRDPDGVITLFQYNTKSEREYTCIDSNRNDVIDFGGQDRITQTVNDVVSAHSTNVLRTRTYLWLTDGSSTSTLLSTVERSVEGFQTWSDTAGGGSSSVKTLPSSGSYTITQTAPDSSYSVTLYQNGRVASVTRYDSASSQIGKTTYGYDSHGRQNTVTDARTGTITYTFNNADQVISVITPPPGTGAGAQTTTTYFDAMGRATNIVQPDGTAKVLEYFLTGLRKKQYGSRDYPVEYSYDPQGRLKTMTTWTNFVAAGGAAVTTWHYDAERGWLTNKVYADNQGTKYGYTAAGRLSSRLWARGTNTSYAFNNFGDLASVTYNDGVTPSVTQTYTRHGQLGKVVRDGITARLFYTTDGQLLGEGYAGGTLDGLRVTNTFDAQLRRTQVATKNGATALNATDYTYDSASRLSTVSDGTQSGTYSYVANSPLVGQITFKQNSTTRMTTTKSYDFLNRLGSISSQPSASGLAPVSFVYSHNDANQRTRAHLTDGSYWSYEYDSLGQIKSGKRYWSDGTPVAGQQFEYGFDDIGNRRTTKAGGDSVGAGLRSASYTLNNLNQITQRAVPGAADVIGAATATATNVNVNNVMAYRRGEYYRVELSIGNGSAAQWQSVTNRAVQNGTTNLITGNIFLPKTPEVLGFDADGNLTNDGHWAYTWDGENHLTRLVAPSAIPTGARQTLLFSNDWQGRRISKVVSNWTGSAWTKSYESKFLYDGWNLVAVLDSANTLLYSFRWGTDLSGTLRGAGGVGGLISMTVHTGGNAGTYFYAYDGNGNIVALINAADGSTAARYEYGPFSELIRATGPLAFLNPFRFSSKFQDDETGFLYYGYRYYDPSTGRWLNRDPIGEGGGSNLYGYVFNKPVFKIDPLGLKDLRDLLSGVIFQEYLDKARFDTVTVTGYPDALLSLFDTIPLIKVRVGNVGAGNEALYYPDTDTIVLPNAGHPGVGLAVHELTHAHNDVFLGISDDRDDEGLAYVFQKFVSVATDLKSLSQKTEASLGCETIRARLRANWPSFWSQWGVIPSSGWGNLTLHSTGQEFPLLSYDIRKFTANYGVKLSCSQIAQIINSRIGAANCGCFQVTCDETSSSPEVFIPTGVRLNPVFR